MDNPFDDLLLEPDETIEPDVLPPLPTESLALSRSLPQDFNLPLLLQFLPDVRLKQKVDALAAQALAIDVTKDGGLKLADAALGRVKDGLAEIERDFADPTSLANQLHKRLTGLRADFSAAGTDACSVVSKRVYTETQRLAALAAETRRKTQEAADKEAQDAARKAAEEAAKAGVPKEVVSEMKQAAKTATAPPVAQVSTPLLTRNTVKADWRARLVGTLPESDEPNPAVKDMTPVELASLGTLVHAIAIKQVPLPAIKELDWGYLNKRASAEKTTMQIPGLEAYDAGRVQAKPRRNK